MNGSPHSSGDFDMPATMKFHGAASPRGPSPRGIENGNKLGERPVVRQSKIYRTNESGNAMKSIFGQDHLAWDTDKQQGVFEGQAVFGGDALMPEQDLQTGSFTGEEVEYPNPGCSASCDSCGEVVTRFYHCIDCREETGLFDLCTPCCAAIYLKQGTPQMMASARPPPHATHEYASHRMVHITAPGSS
jgi:hypothetical protein